MYLMRKSSKEHLDNYIYLFTYAFIQIEKLNYPQSVYVPNGFLNLHRYNKHETTYYTY